MALTWAVPGLLLFGSIIAQIGNHFIFVELKMRPNKLTIYITAYLIFIILHLPPSAAFSPSFVMIQFYLQKIEIVPHNSTKKLTRFVACVFIEMNVFESA